MSLTMAKPYPMSAAATTEWFAAYTYPRHEKKVAIFLNQLEIRTFCPVYTTIHRWATRNASVNLPLFPGYVFVNISNEQRTPVLSAPGVIHIVGSRGKPSPLPCDQIEALQKTLESRKAEPHPFIAPGQTVRVASGPLAGLEGIVLRRKGQMRMIVSLTSINQSIVLDLEQSDLAPVARRIPVM